jgi:serine/threonine protein phosphatase PrpC
MVTKPKRKLPQADEARNTQQNVLAMQVGYKLDPGIRRKDRPNEDTLYVTQGTMLAASPSNPSTQYVLLVVADGMGGQGHGQLASRLAVQSLVDFVSSSSGLQHASPESLLSAGVQRANQVVYECNQQRHTVMGTTMTAALLIGSSAYIAHVGDSRLYLYREPTGLTQMTRDHSVVAELAAAGVIAPNDIYTHPRRNEIIRCLGKNASIEVDVSVVQLADSDMLLLCSDGLWEMVPDQQIAALLVKPMPTPNDTAAALIQAALAGGGKDNVSAIVARVSNS